MANTEELEAAELASSVALHVELPASIDLDRVAVAFGSDTSWLGEPLPPAASGTRLFACDLELRVYLPPGGTVGYVIDRVLPHSAANGTGRWLLQKVIAAVGDN